MTDGPTRQPSAGQPFTGLAGTGPAGSAQAGSAQAPGPHDRGHWRRVHPLTPAVKSWQGLVVLLFVVVQEVGRNAANPDSSGGPIST